MMIKEELSNREAGCNVKNGYLKNNNDENQKMLFVRCVINKEILLCNGIPSVFNEVVKSIRKYINVIRTYSSCVSFQ